MFARFWEGDPFFSRWSTCKFLWKTIYLKCGFQGDEGLDPLHSFGSVHASAIKTFTYLRIFHSVLAIQSMHVINHMIFGD